LGVEPVARPDAEIAEENVIEINTDLVDLVDIVALDVQQTIGAVTLKKGGQAVLVSIASVSVRCRSDR
jgi:hypothetical protein